MQTRVLTVFMSGLLAMSSGFTGAAEVVVSDSGRTHMRFAQATSGVPTPAGDPALVHPPGEHVGTGVGGPYVSQPVPNGAPAWPEQQYDSPAYGGEYYDNEVYADGMQDWGYQGEACESGCESPWFVDLWISSGFTGNPDDPDNESNLPVTFNDRANEYLLNQLYLSVGRNVATSGNYWDAGGRVDLLFGSDYFFTTAVGLETRDDGSPRWNSDGPRNGGTAAIYGLAMPQAYAEFYAPIGTGVNIKAGHFYTTIGYESVMAPENFFYSHAYTMQYGEPFTHTGMLFDWAAGSRLNMHAGFTRGWDTWEDPNSDLGFLGGFSWTSPSKLATVALTVHTSNEDIAAVRNRSVYSLVYTRQIGGNIRYVLQHDFGTEEGAEIGQGNTPETAKWYGLNQYLFYEVTEKFTIGTRIEWFRDQDNARVLALPVESLAIGGNYTALTVGANWALSDRLTLRPEMRWDWSDVSVPSLGRTGMYNDFRDDDQFTLGSDLIYRF
jgi:hypothetical protein